ncbi:hypothetical protein ACOSQ4_013415 [Xanthoceras sorbifolium]
MVGEAIMEEVCTSYSCYCWLLHGNWRWGSHSTYVRLLIILSSQPAEMLEGAKLMGAGAVFGSSIGCCGIKLHYPNMSENVVVVIAVVILVVLFSVQHLGIDRVIWIFAPIVFIWLFLIGGVGIFNIWKYDSSVLRTFSPVYVYRFFKKGDGWTWPSLGGIMLCITGTEALFADLSQFPVLAIQIIFAAVVFPCLLLGYIGQAAYLMQNMDKIAYIGRLWLLQWLLQLQLPSLQVRPPYMKLFINKASRSTWLFSEGESCSYIKDELKPYLYSKN